ncbi:MAG: YceI family protein [Thiobacillus sp.]
MRTPLAIALLGLALNAWAAPENYKIDDSHSFANWSIRHIVGKTTGTFTGVKGTLTLDPDNLNTGAANVTVSMFSLESGHRVRDTHLLSSDYLDAGAYPEMRFVANGFRATGKDTGVMSGQLTLHGATRQVDIPYKVLGTATDFWGNVRTAFEGRLSLNRSDYGITKHVDGGTGMIGNEVDITLLVEALKLGSDGQPVNMKAKPVVQPVATPAPAPVVEPAKKDSKPDLRDMFKGIFN